MAELDYAFLAEYAKVQPDGALTVVGASFTFVVAPTLPASHRLAVAGRVRMQIDEGPVGFRLEAVGVDDAYKLAIDGEWDPSTSAARPYRDGTIGVLFAMNLGLPLPKVGLYTVSLLLAGEIVRELKFDVVQPEPGE